MTQNIKKRKYIPSAFLVIIAIMIIFIIASWIGRALSSEIHGIGLLDTFSAVWHGFSSKVDVILFIFSIGGTLGVLTKLKVIDSGINALVIKLKDKVWLLIPILMVLFGLGGTTYGMWEETIAFIPVLILIFKKANYGPFTAIMVVLLGAGTGCLASTINPFAVGAAASAIDTDPTLDAAGIKFTAGTMQGTRWLSFVVFEVVAISLVTLMARRYRKAIVAKITTEKAALASVSNQNKFIAFFTRPKVVEGIQNELIEKRFSQSEDTKFTTKRKISLSLFILGFILMILLYLPWGDWLNLAPAQASYDEHMWWFASTTVAGYAPIGEWYFISVASIFFLITIIIFAINFKEFKSSEHENKEEVFINSYLGGIKDVISVCMLIAFAGGLSSILDATGFGTLIATEAATGLTSWFSFAIVIFLVSIVLSFLIPSTSGFAAAFIPIFANIAVIAFPNNVETAIGLSILAFLFANGLANFITPTSASLMGYTSYAGVPYNVWLKQTWKFTLVSFILSFILIIIFAALASGGSKLF